MAHFEKVPERPSFDITDDYGHCANLTAEQAYELLQWLYDLRDELFTSLHPEAHPLSPAFKAWQQARPTVEAWHRDHPFVPDSDDKPNSPPTGRYLELRLYEIAWHHIDALKAAIPDLHQEYEAPTSEETGGPVKVLSVRYDSLTQTAINLLVDLQAALGLEYKFRDQLVPTVIDQEESQNENGHNQNQDR